nr:TrkA C-terminal domain-containing protein [Quadrisphaera sp. RL12-1S]
MVELTLPAASPLAGTRVGDVAWPPDTVLVGIIRTGRPIAPSPDDALEGRDQLLLLTVQDSEEALKELLAPPAPDRQSGLED